MIKNATVLVTNKCNSRCIMCNIWKTKTSEREMSVADYEKLFSRKEFRQIEDLNISGGEPTLREDVYEIIDVMLKNMPKVHMFFLSTNGTNPEKIRDLFLRYSKIIKDTYVCVSIEGNRETNNKVRGVDSYDSAIKTIKLCKEANSNIHSIISMTLTAINSNEESLHHIKKIAEETKSTYTFRQAWKNDTYYHNCDNEQLNMSEEQKNTVINFMEKYCMADPFMVAQMEYFKNNTNMAMKNCLAGDIFVLIRPDGSIYPCINSSRKIGDLENGMFIKNIENLGKCENCPCCTECCFYPMLNWSSYSTKRQP